MPMWVNTGWLLEYLEPKCSHEDIVDALPRLGLEIEQFHRLGDELEAIKIGFVRTKKPVPQSPGFHLCEIEIERNRIIPVVCASEHEIQEGWGVPVAVPGTVLATGRVIKSAAYHGTRSEGMICLDGELGMLARGSGMHYFTDEALLGAPMSAAVVVPEYLLELNVLPNRPDFLGLIGIAREIAAFLGVGLRYPTTFSASAHAQPPVQVEIREPELCARYMCGLVRGVRVAASPPWLKARLLLAGMRPINNVVDITNYVLYEWGQPLHAFDFQKISGAKIIVRRMADTESLELLTGAVVEASGKPASGPVSKPPLVIADAERPIALAGIMGGKFAETADSTTDVLIESAHFDPVLIRQSVQRIDLGMESRGTAASYRFERGTDPNLMLEGALKRTSQLVVEIAGGSVVGPLLDQYPAQRKPRRFTIDPARTTAYLGMEVSAGRIRECLGRLSMECGGDDSAIDVTVPTWRADVNDPVVLIEDVARLVGYEAIPDAPRPSQPSLGMRSATDRLRQNVSESLVRLGFLECRNPSLESPQSSRWLGDVGPAITVGNAATREMSVLRRTLLSGLAATVQTNVRRGAQSAWFFEVDRLFGQGELESLSIEAANGRWHLAGIAGGQLDRSSWVSHGASVDFFTLKGVVEDVLELVGARDLVWKPMDRRPFVAGTSAEILLGPDRPIGLIGEIDPKAVEFERVPFRTFAFELDLEALEGAFGELKSYHQLQRQPAVGRDIAVVVSMEVAYADILSTIRQAAGPNLEKVELVDRYQGSQVPAGHQSLAFHTIFRDRERTLTAEEVAEVLDRVVTVLKDRFGAELRS